MNESNTYQAVRIGDIADWRLICVISAQGVGAWLRHVSPTQELVTLFDEKWNADTGSLLERIENTVYDHPQVLDDFSADIAVVAPRSIWVPSVMVADDDDEVCRLYTQVYDAECGDIIAGTVGDATCLGSLVPGLNAFLQRTFPGARIHPHLSVLARRFRERGADETRVFIDIREGEADFIAFSGRTLLAGVTHRWHDPADIQYHLFNIMHVYGLDPASVQVSLSGLRDIKTGLMRELRRDISYVMLTMVPSPGVKAELPLAGSLLLRN